MENLGATRVAGEAHTPNIEVRIGTLYALERVAQDSPRDHIQIMEILTAYIRENAPASGAADEKPYTTPRTDIQTALTIIGRRSPAQIALERADTRISEDGFRLNLSHTNLQRANLSRLNFERTIFKAAQMQEVDLSYANLARADFGAAYAPNPPVD